MCCTWFWQRWPAPRSAAWVAGSRIESPADAAARTAPPTPSPILVPVEQRVLSADVVTRGTVRFGLPQRVSIAPSALKAAPGLVATLPLRNARFEEGDVMLTASGRPVFVLQGQTPAYRDLAPGIVGEDVRQLKQALRGSGSIPAPPTTSTTSRPARPPHSSTSRRNGSRSARRGRSSRRSTLERDLGMPSGRARLRPRPSPPRGRRSAPPAPPPIRPTRLRRSNVPPVPTINAGCWRQSSPARRWPSRTSGPRRRRPKPLPQPTSPRRSPSRR